LGLSSNEPENEEGVNMIVDDKYPGIPRPRKAGDSIGGLTDLLDWIARTSGPKTGGQLFTMAEIGCFSGQSTEVFASRVDKLIAVDSWDDATLLGNTALTQYPMARVKECFLERMERFGNKIHVINMPSLDAAKHIPDGSLSMIYIDADHRYEAVKDDIAAWYPKIRIGGFIAGHDYNEQNWGPQVSRAVKEMVGEPEAIFRDCSWVKRVKA
jgi:predicted O-methyltransferase YrrM